MEQITLRPFLEEDAPVMQALLTDPIIGKTFMLPDYPNREAALPLFQRMLALSKDPRRFVRGICFGSRLVGFLNDTEIEENSIELGYVIDPGMHNRGIMTQALQLAIQELFAMGYRQVKAGAFAENLASMRVMEKCAMHRLPCTDTVSYRGQEHTCIYYAIEQKTPKYKCLVLDHDDTVVQSEATVNYPCFCRYLEQYRPGMSISLEDYVGDCNQMAFIDMCRRRFGMTDAELDTEYQFWKDYAASHIPDAFDGIRALLHRFRASGGVICVSSMAAQENILRDYRTHFGLEPDRIFGWDLPEAYRKPHPWALQQIRAEFGFRPEEILVVDDMKFAVPMARSAGCPIAFAGWGRKAFPQICREMESLCDFSFYSTEELEKFLFD